MVHVQKFLYKCLEAYQNKGISKDYETLRAWGEDKFQTAHFSPNASASDKFLRCYINNLFPFFDAHF